MANFETYYEYLRDWLAFPSVSTDPAYLGDIKRAADWLGKLFEAQGFKVAVRKSSSLNPVVLASYEVDAALPTVLVYGHYDVQPASQGDGWQSDPFELTERHGRLYGRGVVDNKGQVLIHIATVFELITTKQLAYNVKFLIEGNEETGSEGLGDLLRDHQAALACDHILISDGEIPYRPAIEASLRGGFNLRVQYRTAATNQHSGIYGGAIPNAAQELSELAASFYDDDHRVTVPGFYEGLDAPDEASAADIPSPSLANLKKTIGIHQTLLASGQSFASATGLQPTLQISGLSSGYIGEGFANIIPATAELRINVRTAPSQDTQAVYQALAAYIQDHTPAYVDCQIDMEMPVDAVKLRLDTPLVAHARKLLRQAYGEAALISHSGGSIPIVSDFKTVLGRDSLLISLGNDDCNMHGADENFEIGLLKKGLAFSELFFSQRPD